MTDKALKKLAAAFRDGLLGDRSSEMMCFMIKTRLYPAGSRGDYIEAQIFSRRADMLRLLRQRGDRTHPRQHGACSNDARGKRAGRMYLYRRGTTPEIIAHECGHAAFIWASRKGIIQTVHRTGHLDIKSEERICYAIGRMVAQLIAVFQRHGV